MIHKFENLLQTSLDFQFLLKNQMIWQQRAGAESQMPLWSSSGIRVPSQATDLTLVTCLASWPVGELVQDRCFVGGWARPHWALGRGCPLGMVVLSGMGRWVIGDWGGREASGFAARPGTCTLGSLVRSPHSAAVQ